MYYFLNLIEGVFNFLILLNNGAIYVLSFSDILPAAVTNGIGNLIDSILEVTAIARRWGSIFLYGSAIAFLRYVTGYTLGDVLNLSWSVFNSCMIKLKYIPMYLSGLDLEHVCQIWHHVNMAQAGFLALYGFADPFWGSNTIWPCLAEMISKRPPYEEFLPGGLTSIPEETSQELLNSEFPNYPLYWEFLRDVAAGANNLVQSNWTLVGNVGTLKLALFLLISFLVGVYFVIIAREKKSVIELCLAFVVFYYIYLVALESSTRVEVFIFNASICYGFRIISLPFNFKEVERLVIGLSGVFTFNLIINGVIGLLNFYSFFTLPEPVKVIVVILTIMDVFVVLNRKLNLVRTQV